MKRYSSFSLLAFSLALIALIGMTMMRSHADDKTMREPTEKIVVCTTMPIEQAGLLAAEYESLRHVRVDFIPLSPSDAMTKLKTDAKSKSNEVDLVLADSSVLEEAAKDGIFVPYVSEATDSVPDSMKSSDSAWVGTWYDPIVLCFNSDYINTLPHVPSTWSELSSFKNIRVGMTDFLAADAAANFYFSLVATYGEPSSLKMMAELHKSVVQYAKYLSTPVRMAGMGEVDVSIAVLSESIRYMSNGYPVQVVYPEDGTSYMLTGAGLINEDNPRAKEFIEWLLSDEAHLVLESEGAYFVPANQSILAYKMNAGKNMTLFGIRPRLSEKERHDLLDRWVKYVRLQ